MSQQTSRQSISRGYHTWEPDQVIFLMQRLLEARRNRQLNDIKVQILKPVFEGIASALEHEFPARPWSYKQVEYKHRLQRDTWRLFREAANWSGVEYDRDEGKLLMSDAQEQRLLTDYPQKARQIIRHGIQVGGNINYDEYDEIFSRDRAAGHSIREAHEMISSEVIRGAMAAGAAIARAAIDDDEAPAAVDEDDEEVVRATASQLLYDRNGGTDNEVNNRFATQQDLKLPITPTSGLSQTSTPSSTENAPAAIPPNDSLGSMRKRARSELIEAIEILASQANQVKRHHFTARVTGAEDYEKALRDVMSKKHIWGKKAVLKICRWLGQGAMNAVTWNALETDEDKWEWMVDELGSDLDDAVRN